MKIMFKVEIEFDQQVAKGCLVQLWADVQISLNVGVMFGWFKS